MAIQQWKSKALRWQQLTRYYVNKWQYDGSKWADRIWYGTGSKASNTVASVPFMITRTMRAQLEQNGFPAHEISALLPKVAHQLLNDKVSYTQFQLQRSSLEIPGQQQHEANAEVADDEIQDIVATIQAREVKDSSSQGASSRNQIALVPELNNPDTTEQDKL